MSSTRPISGSSFDTSAPLGYHVDKSVWWPIAPFSVHPHGGPRLADTSFRLRVETGISMNGWKDFFCNWPAEIPRRGALVTSFDEQISFAGFLTSEAFLLVERQVPDTLGARMVVLPYENVLALKITDVIKPKLLQPFGFEGSLSKKGGLSSKK